MSYTEEVKKQQELSKRVVEDSVKQDHEKCLRGFIREFRKYDGYEKLGEKAAWLLHALEVVDGVK